MYNCVLVIDDDRTTNLITKVIIDGSKMFKNIYARFLLLSKYQKTIFYSTRLARKLMILYEKKKKIYLLVSYLFRTCIFAVLSKYLLLD